MRQVDHYRHDEARRREQGAAGTMRKTWQGLRVGWAMPRVGCGGAAGMDEQGTSSECTEHSRTGPE